MIWSGFRPSDDAQVYGYNTAVNMYVFGAVVRAMKLNEVYWRQVRFTELARDLCRTIRCRARTSPDSESSHKLLTLTLSLPE